MIHLAYDPNDKKVFMTIFLKNVSKLSISKKILRPVKGNYARESNFSSLKPKVGLIKND